MITRHTDIRTQEHVAYAHFSLHILQLIYFQKFKNVVHPFPLM